LGAMAAMMSPKRPLSLSRDGASVSLRDAVQTTGPKQGAKPTEVYGFVGAISTLVGFAVFLIWAYLPEPWLHTMGVTYYPNRYWAMAIPAYVLVAILFVVSFYASLNYIATPPPCSLNSLFDEYTRSPSVLTSTSQSDRPIHAISDIPITTVNALVFGAHPE
jgi:phosphatidylinositol glycan class P protein